MPRRRKSSLKPDAEVHYRCIVADWTIEFGSGVYSGATPEMQRPFFEEVALCASGRLAKPFRGLETIKVDVTANPAGIRHHGGIGSMRMETDHLWGGVEVSPDHFQTMLTAFAAGKVKQVYVTAEPAKKGNVPISMIVLSTEPVDFLEE